MKQSLAGEHDVVDNGVESSRSAGKGRMVNKDLDGQCHASRFDQITEIVYEKQITPDGNEHFEHTDSI
jgi:hypothetical protein